MEWLNVAFLRMVGMLDRNAVMIEFFDTARINSHRTLPYLQGWHARYADHGLRLDRRAHARLLVRPRPRHRRARRRGDGRRAPGAAGPRLPGVEALRQPRLARALPVRPRGLLRYIHYGEGDYARHRARDRGAAGRDRRRRPRRRPSRCCRCAPRTRRARCWRPRPPTWRCPPTGTAWSWPADWTEGEDYLEAATPGATATVRWQGGEAYAVLSGTAEPGLYETDGTVTADAPGLRLHGFQFTPGAGAGGPARRRVGPRPSSGAWRSDASSAGQSDRRTRDQRPLIAPLAPCGSASGA